VTLTFAWRIRDGERKKRRGQSKGESGTSTKRKWTTKLTSSPNCRNSFKRWLNFIITESAVGISSQTASVNERLPLDGKPFKLSAGAQPSVVAPSLAKIVSTSSPRVSLRIDLKDAEIHTAEPGQLIPRGATSVQGKQFESFLG
jgi:hypothetical protein